MAYEIKANDRIAKMYKRGEKPKEFISIYYIELHNKGLTLPPGKMHKTINIPLMDVLKFDWQLFVNNLQCQHNQPAKWTNKIKLYIERWEFKTDAYKKQILLQCFGCGQWHTFYIRDLIIVETKNISIQWFNQDNNLYEMILH